MAGTCSTHGRDVINIKFTQKNLNKRNPLGDGAVDKNIKMNLEKEREREGENVHAHECMFLFHLIIHS
jgi:hypothetical protein